MRPLILIVLVILSGIGESVGEDILDLPEGEPPYVSPYAYYMSVGPSYPGPPDTLLVDKDGRTWAIQASAYRLRVTLYNCERSHWMTIEVIRSGRADSRSVDAQYRWSNTAIGTVLVHRPRPEIFWLSPTSFAWKTRQDTIVIEHKGGSEFEVMTRPVTE